MIRSQRCIKDLTGQTETCELNQKQVDRGIIQCAAVLTMVILTRGWMCGLYGAVARYFFCLLLFLNINTNTPLSFTYHFHLVDIFAQCDTQSVFNLN